ncbi:MAG: hypothetical protein J5632_05630 [Bacteroidales bacterium]|nr:hypothetical protein [Bacteroidales bacterium]
MKKLIAILLAFVPALLLAAPTRCIIRLNADTPDQIVAAVKAFDKENIQFVLERQVAKDDSPEMKSALAMVIWKNDELIADPASYPDVPIVDTDVDGMDALIARVKDEEWIVKTASVWKKVLREEARTYGGHTYYVAADGDDAADGLSPETAWKSLAQVNDAVLGFGDSVLFKRGDVFRGHLEPQSGSPEHPIYYGAYGEGVKPILEPSWDASSEADWVKVGRRLWKCEKPSRDELGNVILNHGKKGCARKVDSPDQLKGRDLYFCWVRDEGALYMVSRRNPAKRFKSIEMAEKQHVIMETDCHDLIYENLWLRYGAAHGIGGERVKRITARGLDISYIGGSTLYIDDTGHGVRYGNGIEFWSAAEDVLVENCRIWEVWDAAMTSQSNIDGVLQKNITWRGNEVWNSEYSFEYWQQGDGARTENVLVENNVFRDAGKGWGHRQRWNPNAAHLMLYDTTAETVNYEIRGNVFGKSKNTVIRLFTSWYPLLNMHDNTWKVGCGNLIRFHGRPTSDLIYKYPDRLDRTRNDSQIEIESQLAEKPVVLKGKKGLKQLKEIFNFD